jgi:hypothetical protein
MHWPQNDEKDMAPSRSLAEISNVYYDFSIGREFVGKRKVSNLDLKFCPREGPNQTSLPRKFHGSWVNRLW